MAEYIERGVAQKIAEKYGLADGPVLGRHSGVADCIASEIANIPAADVAPVRHGRWEMRPTGMMTEYGPELKAFCTACNNSNKQYQPPYCPHCGARMDGDKE